jgi:hypothetical protein
MVHCGLKVGYLGDNYWNIGMIVIKHDKTIPNDTTWGLKLAENGVSIVQFGTVKIVGTSWKHIEHISQKMHLFSDDLYFSTLTQPVFNLCFWQVATRRRWFQVQSQSTPEIAGATSGSINQYISIYFNIFQPYSIYSI